MVAKRHQNTIDAIVRRGLDKASEAEFVDSGRNTIARVNEFGLTEKQETFAQGVANGLTLKDAYEKAYDATNMKRGTVYAEASRMMDDPKIAARVRALMDIRLNKTHALDAMRIRQHVFDRLMEESVDDDSPPAARIRALELLGKIDVVGMFKEVKAGPKDDDEGNVAELEAKLKAALAKLIDVTPNRVLSAGTKSNGPIDDTDA